MDDQTQYEILAGLEGNRNDTIIFRHGMELYMDWKLGVLTEAKIDAALEACRDLRGIVVPDPLAGHPNKAPPTGLHVAPASLKTFADQLCRDLREPWLERYWQQHPSGVGFFEPIDYDSRPEA